MKWDVLNNKGEKTREIDLPSEIYEVPLNDGVLHGVVKTYRANRRQGTHATKTRSMVSGSGKKPFRQKGTGNARQGSSRSPLMAGGAVVHGPQPRDYSLAANKKERALALKIALSDKVRHGMLVLVEDFELATYSTKSVLSCLDAFGKGRNALLADERKDDYLYRSARNLHQCKSVSSAAMNAEDILRQKVLVLSVSALKVIEQRLSGQKKAGV